MRRVVVLVRFGGVMLVVGNREGNELHALLDRRRSASGWRRVLSPFGAVLGRRLTRRRRRRTALSRWGSGPMRHLRRARGECPWDLPGWRDTRRCMCLLTAHRSRPRARSRRRSCRADCSVPSYARRKGIDWSIHWLAAWPRNYEPRWLSGRVGDVRRGAFPTTRFFFLSPR